jgi:hypothetical protein
MIVLTIPSAAVSEAMRDMQTSRFVAMLIAVAVLGKSLTLVLFSFRATRSSHQLLCKLPAICARHALSSPNYSFRDGQNKYISFSAHPPWVVFSPAIAGRKRW